MKLEKVLNTAAGAPEAFIAKDIVPGINVMVYYTITAQGVAIVGLEIRGVDIVSDQYRAINIGELREAIHAELMTHPERASGAALMHHLGFTGTTQEINALESASDTAAETVAALSKANPDRRRATSDDQQDHYRKVAEAYIEFVKDIGRKGAVKELAICLDAPIKTVYWWIRRAREEGWLAKSKQGQVNAEAGPRLIRFRQEHDEEEEE